MKLVFLSLLEFLYYYNASGQLVSSLLSKIPTDSAWFTYLTTTEVGGPRPVSYEETHKYVTFRLYQNGVKPGKVIKPGCTDSCLDTYQSGMPLVIMTHGFGGSGEYLEKAYVDNGFAQRNDLTFNLVLVDWGEMAAFPYYPTAAANTKPVGHYIADLINFLVNNGNSGKSYTSLDRVHFVGHSLGAQVGNFVANYLEGGKMSRITGLDAASVCFEDKDDSERLDSSDAIFVDAIHTATRQNLDANMFALGMRMPLGDVDFYPNGGEQQPGCDENFLSVCSHLRAVELYAESIRNKNSFFGVPCYTYKKFDPQTCICDGTGLYMGWDTEYGAEGIFYLKTNPKSPYSIDELCPFSP